MSAQENPHSSQSKHMSEQTNAQDSANKPSLAKLNPRVLFWSSSARKQTLENSSSSVGAKALKHRNSAQTRGDSREQEGLEHPHHICQGSRAPPSSSLQDRGIGMKRAEECFVPYISCVSSQSPKQEMFPYKSFETACFSHGQGEVFGSLQKLF